MSVSITLAIVAPTDTCRSAPGARGELAIEYFDAAKDHERIMAKRLFVLSANDETALRRSMEKLGIFLEQHAELYQTTMPTQPGLHVPAPIASSWRVAFIANYVRSLAPRPQQPRRCRP